jgi:hypothetical protein
MNFNFALSVQRKSFSLYLCLCVVIVPYPGLVNCLDSGLWLSGMNEVACKRAAIPSQARPFLKLEETFNRDPTAIEETCAKVTSMHM